MAGKVLYLSNYGDVVGGGEISLSLLIRGLDRSRYDPILVLPEKGNLEQKAVDLNVPVFVSNIFPLNTISAPIKLLSGVNNLLDIINNEKIDIVHSNATARGALYSGAAALRSGVPAVWHVRVLDKEPLSDNLLVRMYKKIITNSESVAGRFKNISNAANKVITVYNPVDLESYKPSPPDAKIRESFGASDEDIIVANVGRLVDYKGINYFIEAAEIIAASDHPVAKKIKFTVVGDGPMRNDLKSQADNSKAHSKIFFTGHREDIPAILNSTDIFVLSSNAEHFGRVLIEAMACRKPVIGTKAGGVPEIIEHDVTGLLIPPRNPSEMAKAIMSLASDKEKAEKIASAGEDKARRCFSIEKHAEKVMNIYDEILKTGA